MFLIILFLLFPVISHADIIADLQFNKEVAEADLYNDPDAIVLERLRTKADKINKIKKDLDVETAKVEDKSKAEAINAKIELSKEADKGINWTDMDNIKP